MNTLFRATLVAGVAITSPAFTQAPAAQDAPSPSEPAEVVEQPDDPEANRILARALEAIGGEQQRAALTSSRSVARLVTDSGTSKFELLTMRPNKFLVRQEIEGLGHMEMGFDGKTAWRRDPPNTAVVRLDVEFATRFARQLDLQALLRELDLRFVARAIDEPAEIDGIECDSLVLNDGETELIAFFDRSTGLPKAFELKNSTDSAPSRRVVIEEWSRDARPVLWARKLRIEQNRTTIQAVYASVTFDDVSETTFDPPATLVDQ